MKKRKGPNTQPGLARQHLLDNYSEIPSPHLIQNGHVLFLYVTAESSRAATAREIIRYIPEMTEEQAKNKVKLLVEKTLTKYRKLTNKQEFSQFEAVCSRRFCGITTTTKVPRAKPPPAEQEVPKLSPLKTRQIARANCPSCTRYEESSKARSHVHLQKSLTHRRRAVKSNSVDDMDRRCCELEERINSMNSEIHDLQFENLLLGEKIQDLESKKTVEQQECASCSCSNAELIRLLEENRMLKKELSQQKMDEDFFKDDDKKVEYYTGLPCFPVLMGVLANLDPYLSQASPNLSLFQMLVSTLMQLKLNLPAQHIAFLFSVDRKTVNTTFRDTIDIMFVQLKPLVHWPERHVLLATLPHQFIEAFGERVSIIVDCFEINIEGALSFKAGSHTFSHCKHKDTLKYLIGFTPLGAITFVSQGWAGHISDKHVTENSGLLNKLLPGDLILAGRGFDIKDSDGLMCAEVKSPAVPVESNQLDVKYVEGIHHKAYLRDHVEKIIGTIHAKSSILSRTLPVSMVLPCPDEDVSFFDKILTVCCTVTNMCPSVVMPWLKP